jgi:HNH endonuclease
MSTLCGRPKCTGGSTEVTSFSGSLGIRSHMIHGVYEHRYVLYERLGDGPQQCWWCGREVRWKKDLDVDHLDYDKSNNDPANLVPSCRACNIGRGAGCDRKGWAISMATRRVLRRHAKEFRREVEIMRARLEAVPATGNVSKERARVQQAGRAARSAYEESDEAA